DDEGELARVEQLRRGDVRVGVPGHARGPGTVHVDEVLADPHTLLVGDAVRPAPPLRSLHIRHGHDPLIFNNGNPNYTTNDMRTASSLRYATFAVYARFCSRPNGSSLSACSHLVPPALHNRLRPGFWLRIRTPAMHDQLPR